MKIKVFIQIFSLIILSILNVSCGGKNSSNEFDIRQGCYEFKELFGESTDLVSSIDIFPKGGTEKGIFYRLQILDGWTGNNHIFLNKNFHKIGGFKIQLYFKDQSLCHEEIIYFDRVNYKNHYMDWGDGDIENRVIIEYFSENCLFDKFNSDEKYKLYQQIDKLKIEVLEKSLILSERKEIKKKLDEFIEEIIDYSLRIDSPTSTLSPEELELDDKRKSFIEFTDELFQEMDEDRENGKIS